MPVILPVAMALALCLASAHAQGPPMQVEEPEIPAAPPVDPARDAGSWDGKHASPVLSPEQRAALEARRKQVEALTREIREKREALEASGRDEKAARLKDLENLILESGDGPGVLENLEKALEKQSQAREKVQTKQLELLEKKLEKAIEKSREKEEKAKEKAEGKSKSPKPGK